VAGESSLWAAHLRGVSMYHSTTQQAQLRLNEQIEQFLSKGGTIKEIARGVSGFNPAAPKVHWTKAQAAKA